MMKRELFVTLRRHTGWFEPLLFFAIVMIMFPMAVSAEGKAIAAYGAGIVWRAVLLSGFLSLGRLLRQDYENGTLEQWLLMPQPLALLLLAKVCAHWLAHGLPLAVLASLFAWFLFLPAEPVLMVALSLLLGTAIMVLIGMIGAALTVPLQRGSLLTGLLVMPLYLPVLIFGTRLTDAAVSASPLSGYFAFLGAVLLLMLVLSPFVAAVALRLMID